MKINQADTYKYEISHFGKLVEHAEGKAGACFDNVIDYCEKYKELGQNTGVSLVLGLRTFDDDKCTMCYHYLVKNNDTGEFSDPQYWQTFGYFLSPKEERILKFLKFRQEK